MFRAFHQFASTSQFYLFGRQKCTRTGWEKASKAYPKPDILDQGADSPVDLSGKVFMITGSNSGIGKEIAMFVAMKNATLYMVCRSQERGSAARDEIVARSKNENVHILIGDCGLEKDVRRIWAEFESHRQTTAPDTPVQLDGLVCNAGALHNELTLTEEEIEATFAAHLLFGTYLLGTLAMPALKATPSSRMVVVSSGGMYNSKFPSWEDATCTGGAKYDGQFAYVYAKRGQVLLCEEWARQVGDQVKVVSCHPGWVDTPGVDAAYGESKRYLQPLRSLWQGAEGIVWLCVAPAEQLEGGAFYLDRAPQVKHLAGPFFTEGSFTKNSPEEVQDMMQKLQQWSSAETRPSRKEWLVATAALRPVTAQTTPIDLPAMMGAWCVLANIPTWAEVGAGNCIERYELDEKKPNTVKVDFEYAKPSTTAAMSHSLTSSFASAFASATTAVSSAGRHGEGNSSAGAEQGTTETAPSPALSTSTLKMKVTIQNPGVNTIWSNSPKVMGLAVPVGITSLIVDCADDYSYVMVSMPDRSALWIMTRATPSEFKEAGVPVLTAYPELAVSADLSDPPAADVGGSSDMEAMSDARKRVHELAVLRRALAKATEEGFDTNKILRAPWRHEERVEKDRAIAQALMEAEAQSEAQAQAQAQAQTQVLAQAEAFNQAQTQALEPQAQESKAQTKAQTQALEAQAQESKAQTKAQTQALEAQAQESKAQTKAHAEVPTQAKAQAQPLEAQPETQVESQAQQAPQSEAQPEVQAEVPAKQEAPAEAGPTA